MPNYRRAYADKSYVFITMVTFKRNPILIKNIELLRTSLKKVKDKYEFEIFGTVILPDHIHMLIKPENIKEYPTIIKSFKSDFSKNINIEEIENTKTYLSESKVKKKEKGVWQRRYWEHTIRDENDLYLHLDYIHYNPVNHGLVKNVKDWQYSSFLKFVKQQWYDSNWGSFDDIKKLNNLGDLIYDKA